MAQQDLGNKIKIKALTVSTLGLLLGVVGVVAVVGAVGALAAAHQEVGDQALQHNQTHAALEEEQLHQAEKIGQILVKRFV